MHVERLFDLSDRTALVTGGGRGIGRHIALGLAEAGAHVVIASRKQANLDATVREIEACGGRASAIAMDVGQAESLEHVVHAAIEHTGRIDVLVNNAGVAWGAPVLDYPLEAWDKVFAVNVRGLWRLSQLLARHMSEAGGGSILNIASTSAFVGAVDEEQPAIAYNASKGAVVSLTRDLAVKLAPRGIRVNAIAPGPFDTDMLDHLRDDPDRLARFHAGIPLARSGGEDDIKGVAVFLASEASAYITGQTLCVDGGMISLPRA